MSSEYKISVILPIYNVDKYLNAALDSIINQTFGFENLEVIMVDDCSSDNSGRIMDEYASKYENFIAIHLDKNSGSAGKPRNVGLDKASADYILFLDSDDEFMPDICEKLYNTILNEDADAVTANALCIRGDEEFPDIRYFEDFNVIFPNKNLEQFKSFRLWGTLYRKSLIDKYDMKFIKAATNDDLHFVYNYYLHSSKIIYLNEYMGVKYYERDVDEHVSLTHNKSKFNLISTFNAFCEIVKMIKDSNPTKDYTTDPFIKLIFYRFEYKWNMSKADKKEIFEKILEYESISDYKVDLPIHYRIMNYFLNHRMFNFLIIIQSIYSSFIMSNFIQRQFASKNRGNVVK